MITSSKLGLNEAIKEWKVYGDSSIYAPPMGKFYQELLGLDLPILLPLPRDVSCGGFYPNWNASTVHFLIVRFHGGTSRDSEIIFEEKFPIAIKTYDTLPLYRQFNEPVVERHQSSDNQVVVDVSVPVSSLGPNDHCSVDIKVLTNPLHDKRKRNLRLKQMTLQLKEIVECFDSGLPLKKELKLKSETVEFEKQITSDGILHHFGFTFPFENDFLSLFSVTPGPDPDLASLEVNYPSATFHKNKNMAKIPDGIPITHTQGFTNSGKLFSIRYELVGKIKISHGKDLLLHFPITVSPFDRESSTYLLNWIKTECIMAKEIFGRENVNKLAHSFKLDEMAAILHRFSSPPRVYTVNRGDWSALGYVPERYGSAPLRCIE